MSPDYRWLVDPTSPQAAEQVVADFTELAVAHQEDLATARFLKLAPEDYARRLAEGRTLSQLLKARGLTQKAYQAFLAGLHGPQEGGDTTAATRFAAEVEFTTGRQILQARGAVDRGFLKWATDARLSHLYRYHRREFESFEELMQAVFEDLPESSTTRLDATYIADELYPFALAHGIQGADRAWGDGTIEKARAAVPLLRGLIHQGDVAPEAVAQVQAIVTDVLTLTGSEFKAKYKGAPRETEQLVITDYIGGAGGIVVIEYHSPLERLAIERRLGSGEWHHGTGHEPALGKLSRISAKAKRRTKPNPLKKVKRRVR